MLENIQKRSVNTALDEKPTMDEMVRAIKGLKDGKALRGDGTPAEVWKYGGANLSNRLHRWIIKIWEEGHVPQSWKDANIVTIYKKGDRTECGNYRGISLLSAAGKIFARILLNRLSSHITPEGARDTVRLSFKQKHSGHDLLPTTTPGKMHRAGSTSVYCVCRLHEGIRHRWEDWTMAATGLWQLLEKYGCPGKFTSMIESLHNGMMVNVRNGGEVSDIFAITNGVKQGCVLAPTLFSIFLSAMIEEAFRDMGDGIYIQSRQNADLFTVAHFRAKTKTINILVRELLFADDSALIAHLAEEIHRIVDAFANASSKFGGDQHKKDRSDVPTEPKYSK